MEGSLFPAVRISLTILYVSIRMKYNGCENGINVVYCFYNWVVGSKILEEMNMLTDELERYIFCYVLRIMLQNVIKQTYQIPQRRPSKKLD